MRILVVSQYFWPENFRINDLVQEWTARGHAVTVLTGKPNYPAGTVFPAYREQPEQFSSYHGARIVRAPMLARAQGSLRLMLNYLSYVVGASLAGPWRLRGEAFDAIFVFEPSPITVGLPAILMGRLKRAPVVFWVLDLWPETLAAIGVVRSPRLLGGVGRLVSFIYNRCTLVLGQSQGFKASIAKYCKDNSKIRYFPSWSEQVFAASDATPAPEVLPKPGVFNVLFAGNIGEAQDLPAVLEAATRLKDNPAIRWLIVGDGRKSDWLQEEVRRRGLQERVLLLGRHPVERMPSFYAQADALLVSLKKDPVFSLTIPGKVQSYLQSGIPLLGMLDGEGAQVIRAAQAGLVSEAGDAAGLANAVLAMAAMTPETRRAMGQRGRVYAAQEFDRDTLMDRLEQLMAEAVQLRAGKTT
ncbi:MULTISPECIES: glycosyltransferase family 4 protein [Hydrogenophaga]|uniref:Group 1 glycosyl transferase n=1 Tax=Hydrogenophaga intermedia TaxID=65786 RepID=A0A1L1PNR4_HYDIT|nr:MULTISPECIES: glycosyltransferase family 4 protein [Hydrogenophaga]AOS81348.1 glycosyltransferase WbuB [Hydrogenophaga sp. PBC]TMU74191.1 glycosyltransferase family 4 protein [Hydrogenophaga intermedia]CDN87676.1 Group 1 glycosyl transferase [Hydrogenophaga intermedia]